MTARWRQIASFGAVLLAVVSVGTAVATQADAKPKKPGAQQFNNCVIAGLDGINQDWTKIPEEAMLTVRENCCLNLGGIYNERTDQCYMPNGETVGAPVSPPVPPPGATAIPPPGGVTSVQ